MLLEEDRLESEQLSREVRVVSPQRLPPISGPDGSRDLPNAIATRCWARQSLWQQLAQYIRSLDDDQFRHALVFLLPCVQRVQPE
ncbi:MAG: hypothetical protein R3C05_20525 [Pirellulaceae bacterium]